MTQPLLPALRGRGERTALRFADRTLTYGQLRAASTLAGLEIRRHRRIAVLAEPRVETAVAIVAALRVGVPAIPVNPASGPAELAHILEDARPGAIVAAPNAAISPTLADLPVVTVDLDRPGGPPGALGLADRPAGDDPPDHPPGEAPADHLAADAPADHPAGEAPALIVYTSGTTGPPKGAVIPGRAIASNLDALARAWAWTADDVVCHALPLFHVHGLVLGILGPLRRGGTAHHLGRFSPEGVAAALGGEATMLFGVPTMYRRLADAAEAAKAADAADAAEPADGEGPPALAAALAGARLLVSGSAALPAAEHARLRALTGRDVIERYGMTETLMCTAIPVGARAAPGTVGPPLAGVDVRLVADDGAELDLADPDEETIGEVHVRGPNLFLGYLNRPDATAAAMHDGWFATGDLATRAADGYLRLVGRRATDLIKSGGYKIGAGEIEAALREHPAVDDAAVTGEPDDDLGERVVAWVVLRPRAAVTAPELVDHVSAMLAPHKRPRAVHLLDELPRNELGKVVKARLGGR